jgi:hypothetical protein
MVVQILDLREYIHFACLGNWLHKGRQSIEAVGRFRDLTIIQNLVLNLPEAEHQCIFSSKVSLFGTT